MDKQIILRSCLIACLLILTPITLPTEQRMFRSHIVFAQPCDDNCPDAYGSLVANLTIYAWNGTHWNQQDETYDYLNYTCPTGFDITVTAGANLRFNVTIHLNVTQAASSAQAEDRTRVYITLETGTWGSGTFVAGWNTRLMDDGADNGNWGATHYWVTYREDWAGGANAGTIYYATIDYDSWY